MKIENQTFCTCEQVAGIHCRQEMDGSYLHLPCGKYLRDTTYFEKWYKENPEYKWQIDSNQDLK